MAHESKEPSIGPFASAPQRGSPGYSIRAEFAGACVLVTGASGYLGSLVVEQLLRTTDVGRVLVLIRGKRGQPASERLERLLHSGLFNLVRDRPDLLAKVELLEGDLSSDDLGLSQRDLAKVTAAVQFVIHSAASIELEADVQHTLRSNYLGTRRLLGLAAGMPALRCFLHVSTAYVNVNQPRGSAVQERIYPLRLGQQLVHHADIVEDLLSLPPAAANVRAQMWLDMWGFPNTYVMGKSLTERLVGEFSGPKAIVRPSLVCGLAGPPYPGYCGNLAGPIGMGVAMAIGLFDCLSSVALVPTHVWDAVPGDVVSSVILAAAAATAAQVDINEYRDSPIGSPGDPMVVHAGTSTTYPISFAEAVHAGYTFVLQNPPPFRLPGGSLFKVPLNYRPDEAAVARCKYWTAWKVFFAVRALEMLGQHKTARRLKYGHMAWEIQNSSKTDQNIFFGSSNLSKLQALLDPEEAASGLFTVTWTLRTAKGGWPRYIATNIAGMYKVVFGITDLKGLRPEDHDFRFIPAQELGKAGLAPPAAQAPAGTDGQEGEAEPLTPAPGLDNSASKASSRDRPSKLAAVAEEDTREADLFAQSLRSMAATWSVIPASGEPGMALEGAASMSPPKRSYGRSVSLRAPPSHTAGNAGGLRQVLSAKLAASLSYSAPRSTKDD